MGTCRNSKNCRKNEQRYGFHHEVRQLGGRVKFSGSGNHRFWHIFMGWDASRLEEAISELIPKCSSKFLDSQAG